MSTSFKVAEYYGCRVFDSHLMRERLSEGAYAALERSMRGEAELTLATAEEVATAMKEWALEHGATHFSHWFQPLTGVTAEKHVAFIGLENGSAQVISEFSGKELVKGELDASSFPNGGLRATFEARGYTTWDCTSPAFLREDATGTILCIPTAFCSYSGDALDVKTPLLRSMEAVNAASLRLLRVLGDNSAARVIPMSGPEQEYFLISKEKYLRRKDLVYTGRTLFGAMPAKDQEHAAHYSGSIDECVGAFMKDVNDELWRSGVPAKIQHNEFAPSQHEICPIYSTANIATDQNQLIMETLKKVAERHDLTCLLHEKPFNGINGSGKHNNWSLVTDKGKNLMDPGKTDEDNLRFLLVLSCVIAAVDRHAGLLRLSAACVGNDHRLGGDDAPPAIISIYLGETLEKELQELTRESGTHHFAKEQLRTGVPFLPAFNRDMSDRNRTSPFAFNGNRFEFRMVGSSDSVAGSNTVLNSIVAEAFNEAADAIKGANDPESAVFEVIRRNMEQHGRILFDGNGYSQEWVEEAARRGLPNLPGAVDAIPELVRPESIRMFSSLGVFSEAELRARVEIRYENYVSQLHIESRTMLNITRKQILPAVIKYTGELSASINQVRTALPGADTTVSEELLARVLNLLSEAGEKALSLEQKIREAEETPAIPDKAAAFYEKVAPAMEELRAPLDALEKCVDKKLWPFPSYGDILFDL